MFNSMDENYDDDPLGLLAEFKKGRYMSFSIDSSNLYLNEIPEGDYSDGKNPKPGWPSIHPPPSRPVGLNPHYQFHNK